MCSSWLLYLHTHIRTTLQVGGNQAGVISSPALNKVGLLHRRDFHGQSRPGCRGLLPLALALLACSPSLCQRPAPATPPEATTLPTLTPTLHLLARLQALFDIYLGTDPASPDAKESLGKTLASMLA